MLLADGAEGRPAVGIVNGVPTPDDTRLSYWLFGRVIPKTLSPEVGMFPALRIPAVKSAQLFDCTL